MTQAAIRKQLEQTAFCRGMPAKAMNELARLAESRNWVANTLLFNEGDDHRSVYLIQSGEVMLDMHVPGRGAVRILTVGPGDILGWSPIVGDNKMTARATTQSAMSAIAFPTEALRELCQRDHEIGYHVMRQIAAAMSQRLLATRLQMLDLFAETTPEASN